LFWLFFTLARDEVGDIVFRQFTFGVGTDLSAMPEDRVGIGDLVHVADVMADENDR